MRTLALNWRRYGSIWRADEKAAEALNLSDEARMAIRKVNAAHRPGRVVGGSRVDDLPGGLESDEADRRGELVEAIGPGVAKDFFAIEESVKNEVVARSPTVSPAPSPSRADAAIPPSEPPGAFQEPTSGPPPSDVAGVPDAEAN
jgi:hypothetical protein